MPREPSNEIEDLKADVIKWQGKLEEGGWHHEAKRAYYSWMKQSGAKRRVLGYGQTRVCLIDWAFAYPQGERASPAGLLVAADDVLGAWQKDEDIIQVRFGHALASVVRLVYFDEALRVKRDLYAAYDGNLSHQANQCSEHHQSVLGSGITSTSNGIRRSNLPTPKMCKSSRITSRRIFPPSKYRSYVRVVLFSFFFFLIFI